MSFLISIENGMDEWHTDPIQEIKRTNLEIRKSFKRTRKDSKHIIILVILLEHRKNENYFETTLLKCNSHAKFQGNPWHSPKWGWGSKGDSLLIHVYTLQGN